MSENGYLLRFIEQMPLDAQHGWKRTNMATADESSVVSPTPSRSRRSERRSVAARPLRSGSSTAAPAASGVIGSVSRPFCGACDRVRLTADGQIRNCLFAREETDLRAALRSGCDDSRIAEMLKATLLAKKAGHGINDVGFLQPTRPMSAIGG